MTPPNQPLPPEPARWATVPAGPTAPFGYDPAGRPYSDKQRLVAGLLGIFFGCVGAGRFYTGHTNMGLVQLGLTIVTLGFGAAWGIVDGVLTLVNGRTDVYGRPLRD
jgi:TM2 domain-containing membrane protein YozV